MSILEIISVGARYAPLLKNSLEQTIKVPMSTPTRSAIYTGLEVQIILKADQRTGKLTQGIVKEILTSSPVHQHGIKVKLTDGKVGRVQRIVG